MCVRLPKTKCLFKTLYLKPDLITQGYMTFKNNNQKL